MPHKPGKRGCDTTHIQVATPAARSGPGRLQPAYKTE